MLKNLKKKLVKKGINSPEKFENKITVLSDTELEKVTGARKPPLGFGQAFSSNSGNPGGGFIQTIFTQNIN